MARRRGPRSWRDAWTGRASGPPSRPTRATRPPCAAPPSATRSAPTDADDALQRALEILLIEGAVGGPARTGPLDADGGQARGAGRAPRPRADPQRPGRGEARRRPRGLGGLASRRVGRPGRARRAPRSRRPQPRGAAGPEATGAAGADAARARATPTRRSARSPASRTRRSIAALAEGRERYRRLLSRRRRRRPLRGPASRCSRPSATARRAARMRRRCASTCAPAPTAGRLCAPTAPPPAPPPRWRRRCRSRARCSTARMTRSPALSARFGGGGGGRLGALSGRRLRWRPRRRDGRPRQGAARSAPAPPGAPRPASPPAWSPRRSSSIGPSKRRRQPWSASSAPSWRRNGAKNASVEYEPAPAPEPEPERKEPPATDEPAPAVEPIASPEVAASSGAVEYAPPPEPVATPPAAGPAKRSGGNAAGEFGP